MAKVCKVSMNGQAFSARCGDLLLDAALMGGIDIPFDCRSGYCGTCRVRVTAGRCFGGDTGDPGWVLACQSRVISDLDLAMDEVPEAATQSGHVTRLTRLAPDVVEVAIALARPASHLPGQYYKVQFRGFPARCYSATVPFAGRPDALGLRFHVRLVRDGRVSSELGRRIRAGHRVTLDGPLGSAFLRPGGTQRLVLVAGGTGFAPIWAIADAAMRENDRREIVLVVGVRQLRSLYMIPALCRLARCPNVAIIPVVDERQIVSDAVRPGQPTDYLPLLSPDDIVYVAGAPAMTEHVVRMARASGATCFADPFEAAAPAGEPIDLMGRMTKWFGTSGRSRRAEPAPHVAKHKPAWLSAQSG